RVGSGEGEAAPALENEAGQSASGLASSPVVDLSLLSAPVIVTMVTPEQIVATVGPQIMQEIEQTLATELEAATAWSLDDDLIGEAGVLAGDQESDTSLEDLLDGPGGDHAGGVDSFFGSL
ncbi:MAG: hypothetical protein IT423_13675, partial [Pirellulaceae bacterium]|nr:hypothetical protein [Pirellulaceae bacterium]